MKIIKIATLVCFLIILSTPLIGATKIDEHNTNEYTCCKGFAYGEIEDCKLSIISRLIHLLKGETSSLLITRATITIRQNPDIMSLEILDPINHYCMAYYGNISINFHASIAILNFNSYENYTFPFCTGFFGHIIIEKN
jgi:hypothetical protein